MYQLDFGHVYANVSAQPAEQEPNYIMINFSKSQTESTYTTIEPFQPQEQDHTPYSVVNLKNKRPPEWACFEVINKTGVL